MTLLYKLNDVALYWNQTGDKTIFGEQTWG
jgi:hypothetical protein